MIKEEQVKEYLLSKGVNYADHATVFATAQPSVGMYGNGIAKTMESNREHILHFNLEGIAVIGINELNADIISKQFVFIPNDQIQGIKMKMGLLGYTMTIETEKGELKYRIRPSMIGYPWHKENLSFIILRGMQPAQ